MVRIFLLVISSFSTVFGQEYYSKIVPFDHEGDNVNPNAFSLVQFNNDILIANIYEGERSTLTRTNLNGDIIENVIHVNFDFANDPFTIVNDDLFLYAKDRELENDTRIKRLNSNLDELYLKSFTNPGTSSFPFGSIAIGNEIYLSSLTEFDGDNSIFAHIKKVNLTGDVQWDKDIGDGYTSMLPYKLAENHDSNLLVASGAIFDFNRRSIVSSLNSTGETEWEFESEEPAYFTSKESLVSVDGKIVLSNLVDRGDSLEFIVNNFHPIPPKLTWITSEGIFIKDTVFKSNITDERFIVDLSKGNGSYFFGYGYWNDNITEESYGWLFKMSIDGDIIWQRKYLHLSFEKLGYNHIIRDMIEHDNRDITLLMSANQLGQKNNIILTRVNQNGCYGGETCEDVEIYTNTSELSEEQNILVFPNQSSSSINFKVHQKLELNVYNAYGELVYYGSLSALSNQVEISGLTNGIYFYTLGTRGSVLDSGKFVKN